MTISTFIHVAANGIISFFELNIHKVSTEELMLLNCGVREDS